MSAPTISVIMPTLNEIRALPGTLEALLQNHELHECIVVDGGSTDGTPAFATGLPDPRVRLITAPRGRGSQLHAGAQQASGDAFLFLHADTRLPADAFALIAHALGDGAVWGGFRHQFSEPTVGLRLVSALHNLRCRISGVVYGDQAMFTSRDLYFAAGGFPGEGLEDLAFSDAALAHAPSTLLPAAVVTDSRKFKQIGTLRALWHVISIILRYERRASLKNEAFFHDYR